MRNAREFSRLFQVTMLTAIVMLMLGASAGAVTIYVDQSYGDGGDGSEAMPYDTIQEAIDDFNSDTIIVYPGTYTENLHITKNIAIYAYDGPNTTWVDGSLDTSTYAAAVKQSEGVEVYLQGLHLGSSRSGVYVPKGAATILQMKNCIVCGNIDNGIWIHDYESSNKPTIRIYNSVIVANGSNGVVFNGAGNYDTIPPYLTILNTVFVGNQGYGIAPVAEADNDWRSRENIVLDYNNSVNNVAGPYDPRCFGEGKYYSIGAHTLPSVSPDFVGGPGTACQKDFRLDPLSAMVDAGMPGVGWLDPDGTVNDIGAYGGPGAQTFFTSPNDGPVVRDVHIDQGAVPQGETFTLRATGAVR